MKTKDVLTIVAFVITVTGFVSLFFYKKGNSDNLKENGIRTVGKINLIGKDVICTYTIKDQVYVSKRVTSPYYGLVSGEYYMIGYDSLDYHDFEIIYSSPVLSKEYQYGNTKTDNINVAIENDEVVKYTFTVANNKYERLQKKDGEKKVNEQDAFLVKYNVANPQMAYVYLDSIVTSK